MACAQTYGRIKKKQIFTNCAMITEHNHSSFKLFNAYYTVTNLEFATCFFFFFFHSLLTSLLALLSIDWLLYIVIEYDSHFIVFLVASARTFNYYYYFQSK